jgi:hypothetical protein
VHHVDPRQEKRVRADWRKIRAALRALRQSTEAGEELGESRNSSG